MSQSSPEPLNWNTGSKSALVNVGTHSLALQISGPDHNPNDPTVVIFPGLACGITGWAAVRRLLEPFIRVVTYERSGYGDSETSAERPTSVAIARELDVLLRSAKVQGPFILLGHSWGGVLARELLELRHDDIAGCIFVDSNQEHTLEVLDWRRLAWNPVVEGITIFDTELGMQTRSKLTPEEWRVYRETEMSEKHQRQAAREFEAYADSFPVMKEKQQLGRSPPYMGLKPVYVLKGDTRYDFEQMFAKGLKLEKGTDEDKKLFLNDLKGYDKEPSLQREILELSSVGMFEEVKGSGHHVNLTAPERVVVGVKWVLEHVLKPL